METIYIIVVDLEYDCSEATEELAVSLLVEHIISCYGLFTGDITEIENKEGMTSNKIKKLRKVSYTTYYYII